MRTTLSTLCKPKHLSPYLNSNLLTPNLMLKQKKIFIKNYNKIAKTFFKMIPLFL